MSTDSLAGKFLLSRISTDSLMGKYLGCGPHYSLRLIKYQYIGIDVYHSHAAEMLESFFEKDLHRHQIFLSPRTIFWAS